MGPFWLPRALSRRFEKWLDDKLGTDTFNLAGDQIVVGRGIRPEHRINVPDVVGWRTYAEMSFDVVAIELSDGRAHAWVDKYDDLIGILRRVAGGHEQPWTFA